MLIPIQFHVKAGNWAAYKKRQSSRNYEKIKQVVHERDESTCRYCGYASPQNPIVNMNFDYQDNKSDNIIVACSICVQIVLLDGHGVDPNFGGTILFLPEMSQPELNHLMRAVFAASERQPSYKTRLSDFIIGLEERKDEVENLLCKKAYESASFAQGLLDAFIVEKKLEHPLFKSLRFLPDKSKLKEELPEFVRSYFDHH